MRGKGQRSLRQTKPEKRIKHYWGRTMTLDQFTYAHSDLFNSGALFLDGHTIVGRASDGNEVQIGTTEHRTSILTAHRYLLANPTPNRW